jgi:hypothetical protein
VAVAVGLGDGDGVAPERGVAVAVGLGDAIGVALGRGDAVVPGLGDGVALGSGVAVGAGLTDCGVRWVGPELPPPPHPTNRKTADTARGRRIDIGAENPNKEPEGYVLPSAAAALLVQLPSSL